MRDYEITFILSTAIDEEASAATVERVNQLITNGGGSITEVHAWGRRHLAYPIEHQRDGFYVTTRFSMPPNGLGVLDNDLRLNENILRHLVVRQDEVPIRPVVPTPAQGIPGQTSGTTLGDAELQTADTDSDLTESLDEELVPAADDAEEVEELS